MLSFQEFSILTPENDSNSNIFSGRSNFIRSSSGVKVSKYARHELINEQKNILLKKIESIFNLFVFPVLASFHIVKMGLQTPG